MRTKIFLLVVVLHAEVGILRTVKFFVVGNCVQATDW